MDRGPWTLDFRPWTLDLGPWTLDPGPWTGVRGRSPLAHSLSQMPHDERVAVRVALQPHAFRAAVQHHDNRPARAHDLMHAMPGPCLDLAARENQAVCGHEELAGRCDVAGKADGRDEVARIGADHAVLR